MLKNGSMGGYGTGREGDGSGSDNGYIANEKAMAYKEKNYELIEAFLISKADRYDIKGVWLITVIGFVAKVGDIGRFADPKRIQQLAGLEIVKKSILRMR